jgi:hypothetical protein
MTQYIDLTELFNTIKADTNIDFVKDSILNLNTELNIISYDFYLSEQWLNEQETYHSAEDLIIDVTNAIHKFFKDNNLLIDIETDLENNTITINKKIELILSGGYNHAI